jgi:uncharacterized membrane protein YdjX (TVP38/TMEM64 family)
METSLLRYQAKVFKLSGLTVGSVLMWMQRQQLVAFFVWVTDRQAVIQAIHGWGAWGLVTLFALLFLQVIFAFIPGHALVLAGGYVYGLAVGSLVTAVSTILGGEVAFLLSRRYGRRMVERFVPARLVNRWDRVAVNQGGWFYFISFILPVFPSDAMCFVAGLGKVKPGPFLAANASARILSAVFLTLIGARGFNMPLPFWVAAGCVLLACYAGRYLPDHFKHVLMGYFNRLSNGA